jgi:hypothetical protein
MLGLTLVMTAVALAGCASGSDRSTHMTSPLQGEAKAADTSSEASKTIRVFDAVFGGSAADGIGHAVITGGIGDYGTTARSTVAGKPDRDGNYLKFTLRHGTFLVTDIHDKTHLSKRSPQCTTVGVATFNYVLSHGTGQYVGITGSLKSSVTIAEVTPKVTSGRDKGQCPTGANIKGAYYSDLNARGTITL